MKNKGVEFLAGSVGGYIVYKVLDYVEPQVVSTFLSLNGVSLLLLADFAFLGVAGFGVFLMLNGKYRWLKTSKDPEKKELYRKIHEELKDGIESLDNTLERDTYKVEVQGKEIYWKHIFMNHAVYDSLINSGDFNQIDHKLQQPIQNIYGKINIHDEHVRKMNDDDSKIQEYAIILDKYEKELLKDIPPVMQELKKYFQ
ncbi:MAG: hypothetical protein ACREBI_00655 [Nitrosotalea sp.]